MKKQLERIWKEWRGTVLFLGFVLTPIKSSLADMNWVPTASMNPTILEGDLVFINKASYGLRVPLTRTYTTHWNNPERGDVVVFFSPDTETRMVKRVIGTPGDALELRNNTIFLNGEPLSYTPLDPTEYHGLSNVLIESSLFAEENLSGRKHSVMALPHLDNPRRSFPEMIIPENQYFFMGDNRDNSLDSRHYGFVDRERIIGEAKGVIVSFDINNWLKPRIGRTGKSLR